MLWRFQPVKKEQLKDCGESFQESREQVTPPSLKTQIRLKSHCGPKDSKLKPYDGNSKKALIEGASGPLVRSQVF